MRIYALIVLLLLTSPLTAHAQEKVTMSPSMQKEAAAVAENYYCPMHANQHGKKGDVCPICKMHLVPVPSNMPEASTPVPEKPAEVSP